MKRLALALCAATLPFAALPAPAHADDDLAAQYRAARATFLPFGTDPVEARRGIAARLEAAVGAWVPMSVGAPGAPEIDAGLMDTYCSRGGDRLEALTPYRFTLTRQGGTASMTRTFDYIAASTFQERSDDAEFLDFLGLGSGENIAMAISMLERSSRFGPVIVLWPGADTMVMLPQTGPATIWLRCP